MIPPRRVSKRVSVPDGQAIIALIPAAGLGARFNPDQPKQHVELRGATVVEQSVKRVQACSRVVRTVVALAADDPRLGEPGWAGVETLVGGSTRAETVLNMLDALSGVSPLHWVMVHDAARPCVRASDIDALIDGVLAAGSDGGILATRVRDTVKRVGADRRITQTVPRDDLWCAATPQVFRLGALREAMHAARRAEIAVTDEASAMEFAGHDIIVVEGRDDNLKITRPDDLALALSILERQEQARTGET
ncbi:MAG: 2-C-methyl-D-erythritol 4-phosphate cytidylyltransferase [Pseudomonadota bacterium]